MTPEDRKKHGTDVKNAIEKSVQEAINDSKQDVRDATKSTEENKGKFASNMEKATILQMDKIKENLAKNLSSESESKLLNEDQMKGLDRVIDAQKAKTVGKSAKVQKALKNLNESLEEAKSSVKSTSQEVLVENRKKNAQNFRGF